MRQSKSQRREQNYRYSRTLGSRVPERNVMSHSAERKATPESRILCFLRRLRNGWGMVLLAVLLSVYLMGFYHHASSTEPPQTILESPETLKAKKELPLKSYLVVSTSTDYQGALPGSVKSTASSFEITAEDKGRDANTLPGAIGLEGSFDEHGDKVPGLEKNDTKPGLTPSLGKIKEKKGEPSSGPGDQKSEASPSERVPKPDESLSPKEQNSEISPSTKQSTSNDMVTTGEEKPLDAKKMKKRKKKRRKKTLKSGTAPDSSESSKTNLRKRKKRKRRKKKAKKAAEETSKSSSSKSEAKETKSSAPEEKNARKEGDATPAEGKSNSMNTTARTAEDAPEKEDTSDSGAPRPMDRNVEELQVPGETGVLDEEAVKGYYGKLVKAYLAPFTNGINRKAFFKVLRRRTYSLSPPGSNKGVQTILFQLIKKKLFLMDPYEVMKNSKPFYKTRVNELIGLFTEIARGGKVPDTEFLVAIHDCVQTVNADHTYRGAVFRESNPTFTIVSCNFSDNIPIPMWEGDPVRGGLKSWDKKMEVYKTSDKTPWAEKKEKAVFRGGNRPSMFFKKKSDADKRCDDAGRSRLSYLGNTDPDLFDVSVSGRWCGKTHEITPLSETDHHQFKYILYAEGNCFWADRLNKQVFGPSAIIKQETPCGQFWEPLLKPMTHYVPTDFFFQDTVDQIKWAKEHDKEVQTIVKNSNEFAANFLSEKGIKTYVEVLLTEYTKLLSEKSIEPEKGSREVTGR